MDNHGTETTPAILSVDEEVSQIATSKIGLLTFKLYSTTKHLFLYSSILKVILCTPSPPPLGGTYSQIFKKQEGLTGPQLLGGGCWERGSDVSGGVQR